LHKWVVALPGFADDPKASSEGKLEAIQMRGQDGNRGASDFILHMTYCM